MQPLRLGVTGSGFMGRTHVEAALRIPETEVVAVAGGRRAADLASRYGIACEADAEALAGRPDIDAVVVTTPHYVHCREAMLAARHGKHVLVEKPLATSVEDGRRVLAACREAGVVVSVGYHQRFRESNQAARQLIQSGAIGTVRCIQTSALFDIEALRQGDQFGGNWSWWQDPRSIAHLLNSGPHTIDLCRWWLGSEVVSVSALSGTFREANPNENTTMALLQFGAGVMVSFWSSSVLPAPGFPDEDFRFRVMGDRGLLDVNPYGEVRLAVDGAWETVYRQPQVEFDNALAAFQPARLQAYSDQLAAFARTVAGTPGGEGTGEDGLAGVAAVLAMLEASQTGRVVVPVPS
jgi:predicted dehydrogenase